MTVYASPGGTGSVVYSTSDVVVGRAAYTGQLYPNVNVLPQITVSSNQIDGVTVGGTASAGDTIVATSPTSATWQAAFTLPSGATGYPGGTTLKSTATGRRTGTSR